MTNAIAKGCEEMRSRIAVAAVNSNGVFAGADPRDA